jgi:hypothetical protein
MGSVRPPPAAAPLVLDADSVPDDVARSVGGPLRVTASARRPASRPGSSRGELPFDPGTHPIAVHVPVADLDPVVPPLARVAVRTAGAEAVGIARACLEDALAYAQWKGRSLPTEAQFEYAAQGTSHRDVTGAHAANNRGNQSLIAGVTFLGASAACVLVGVVSPL